MLLEVKTSVSYPKEYGLHLWICIYYVYVSSENPQVSNAECVLFLYSYTDVFNETARCTDITASDFSDPYYSEAKRSNNSSFVDILLSIFFFIEKK